MVTGADAALALGMVLGQFRDSSIQLPTPDLRAPSFPLYLIHWFSTGTGWEGWAH